MVDQCAVPFTKLCGLLERLQAAKGKSKKTLLKDFFDKSRVPNFFPVVRLIVPGLDLERAPYGLKERGLAKMYAELLVLPHKEKEALLHFKDPSKQLPGTAAGNIISVLESVLRNRAGDSAGLTVEEVNRLLDELAEAPDNDTKKRVLSSVVRSMNSSEQSWMARIILKDMKIGTNESILKAYHDRAYEIYSNTNNLREVFTKLQDRSLQLGTRLFSLHQPIRPMLAGRKSYQELKRVLGSRPVYVETKFDGERIQCHFERFGDIRFFTRNANDYTQLYGAKMRDLLLDAVVGVDACILDGEMIVWDALAQTPLAFGHNKTVANAEESSTQHLCYMVFDLLYMRTSDGQEHDLMGRPLSDRKELLKSLLREVPNRLQPTAYAEVQGAKAVFDAFNLAVERNEEGLIVKAKDSPYVPDDRSDAWLKLKSDYIDNIGDSLDLLVVGGYYGSGFRAKTGGENFEHITTFLCAVSSKVDVKAPKRSKFIPFCKVGTGYSLAQLQELRTKLKPQWRRFTSSPDYWPAWSPPAKDRPDFYIEDPSKSVVLELKGAEIVDSDSFPSACVLRFPRVQNIRYDKPWNETMTYQELRELVDSFRRKIPTVTVLDEAPKRKRELRPRTRSSRGDVLESFRDTDTSSLQAASGLFNNFEFLVLQSKQKEAIERLIVQYGGTKVQNWCPSTTHVIADSSDSLRVRSFIDRNDVTVFRSKWVVDCTEQGELLAVKPQYLLSASSDLKASMQGKFTSYGDSFVMKYSTVHDYLDVARQFPPDRLSACIQALGPQWISRLPQEALACIKRVKAFKLLSFNIYIPCLESDDQLVKGRDLLREVLTLRVQAHGGQCSHMLTDYTTHSMLLGRSQEIPGVPNLSMEDLNQLLA
jgi:DNA ligase-4